MKVIVKVDQDRRYNYFFLQVFKPDYISNYLQNQSIDFKSNSKLSPIYKSNRVYDTEEEANLAAAIMQLYFLELNCKSDFDSSEFDFRVRTVFRLLDCPNKW